VNTAVAENYQDRDDVKAFALDFAAKHQRSANDVFDIISKAKKQQSILDAISRPAEKVLTWGDYRKIFIDEKRLSKGIEFWQEHRELITKVSNEFQVPAEMFIAIIGVETRYGKITGSYKVLDALATLGFDYPPRATFFRGQLEQYLLLTDEQKLDPFSLKGSYAGAMGYGQFIPGSYRAYAVDYDKDGVADIWNNPTDAIASVANYFKQHKWQPGGLVAFQLPNQNISDDLISKGLKPNVSIKSLRKAGVIVPKELDGDTVVSLMKHETENGPEYWLGFHNFYVITRYNHSSMYALAAFQLSQLLAAHLEGL
jgi:membrane-bound lytic murein transglycosylase B